MFGIWGLGLLVAWPLLRSVKQKRGALPHA
jgi:hypothetical protein